jgi:hypothetical protein
LRERFPGFAVFPWKVIFPKRGAHPRQIGTPLSRPDTGKNLRSVPQTAVKILVTAIKMVHDSLISMRTFVTSAQDDLHKKMPLFAHALAAGEKINRISLTEIGAVPVSFSPRATLLSTDSAMPACWWPRLPCASVARGSSAAT